MTVTSQAAADIEARIDTHLQQEQAAATEKVRTAVRARLVEEDRLAEIERQRAEAAAARAAFLGRAQAMYGDTCAQYKSALDAFRATRVKLHGLDIILDRPGFGTAELGVLLRHAVAAPNECDLNDGLPAAVSALRKELGG
jgi:hypothetical protein